MRNYFTCIRKVGPVWIRSDGMFGSWSLRFVVLCNAGMIYFKVDTMRKEDDLKPKNFRPLNDFVLHEVPIEVSENVVLTQNSMFIGDETAILFPCGLLPNECCQVAHAYLSPKRAGYERVDQCFPHAPD